MFFIFLTAPGCIHGVCSNLSADGLLLAFNCSSECIMIIASSEISGMNGIRKSTLDIFSSTSESFEPKKGKRPKRRA